MKVTVKKDKKKYKKKVKIIASKDYLNFLKREEMLKSWVKEHTHSDLDSIIDDYNAIEDISIKERISERVAGSDTTMFDKSVTVTGVVDEFVEGKNGFSKASFMMTSENGHKIRISAKGKGNDALDIGKIAVITGKIIYPLLTSTGESEYFIREAHVTIKTN